MNARAQKDEGQSRVNADAAGRRLLAYLHRVSMPEAKRLETALGVLQDAERTTADEEAVELGAMRGLLRRLDAPRAQGEICPTPPITRTPMAPEFPRRRHGRGERRKPSSPRLPRERGHRVWSRAAGKRRMVLLFLISAPTAAATVRMATLLPHHGSTGLEVVLLVVFACLFAWISIGFWTAMAGFVAMLRRYDRFAPTREDPSDSAVRPGVRTAIVFPVYGEDMDRVTAGIEAVHASLSRTGQLRDFDFFILSDTRNPEAWAEEEAAWAALRDRLDGRGRIFYRRRRINTKKKSGNIEDFCRRFGARYTYMLVMDADSVMSGETVTRMVAIMERKRTVGILQTVPGVMGRDTPLARVQQFSSRLYGPMFSAGLHFWLLGDAQFWGHNALIRLKPFMRHCVLPKLSGKPPLGGEISSHDFVESALMRSAGWSVWMACDLPGSYEETPPNLLAELARDRRWCMGNLQHLRLVFTSGLFPIHRTLFLNGVMAYGSALLWFIFLAVSSAEAIIEALIPPTYFCEVPTLFPVWPIWEPWWALSLLLTTGVLLFLPKVFSVLLVLIKGRTRLFGGLIRIVASILLEIVVSSLLAPIRMQFHSKFVFTTLLGRVTAWETQQREDRPTPWGEAVRFHLGGTLLAMLWAAALHLFNERFFWWVSPIFLPLALSIPLSVATSLPGFGRTLRRAGLLLVPEEVEPPRELAELNAFHRRLLGTRRPLGIPKGNGVALAVADPSTCGLRLGLMGRPGREAADDRTRGKLVEKALSGGPGGLSPAEKSRLLGDPSALIEAHRRIWLLPVEELRARWLVDIG